MNHAGPIGVPQGTKNLPEPFRRLERPTRRGPGGRSLERQVLSHPVSGFPREVSTHVGCADPPMLLAQEAAGLNFFTYPASRASKPPGMKSSLPALTVAAAVARAGTGRRG